MNIRNDGARSIVTFATNCPRKHWPTMKHLVIIFGPPAVGKMAVGQELSRATGLRLFHNHMAIETVLPIFPFGSPSFNRIVRRIRDEVFQEVAASDLPGLIYTCMWDLDSAGDRQFIDGVCDLFRENGAAVHFVELFAPLEERVRRNRSELRLQEKPSKRDVASSEKRLRTREIDSRMNSAGNFYYPKHHIWINNTEASARDVAQRVISHFSLPVVDVRAQSTASVNVI